MLPEPSASNFAKSASTSAAVAVIPSARSALYSSFLLTQPERSASASWKKSITRSYFD